MHRLHAERGISIDIRVPPEMTVRVQREDLDEMIGNLLDNACKWGRSHLTVDAQRDGAMLEVLVDDDGSGLEPGLREAVLQRGVRADEAAPGSGLGLAIVRDLAEVYGGSVSLEESSFGGLRARLRLPLTSTPGAPGRREKRKTPSEPSVPASAPRRTAGHATI